MLYVMIDIENKLNRDRILKLAFSYLLCTFILCERDVDTKLIKFQM